MVGRQRQRRARPTTGEYRPMRELREQGPKAVVRLVLFQSISPDSIPDDASLNDIDFTRTIFIRKSGSNNPNQLMPVGGKVDEGESLPHAARREVVQETHLRPSTASVRYLSTVQTYDFPHLTSGTQKRRRSYMLSGRLLPQPMDIPYALDPDEDKIAQFEYLSPTQVDELLERGRVDTPHGQGELLDSLLLDAQERTRRGVVTDQSEVEDVHHELRTILALTEVDKKLSVMRQIIRRILPTVTLETRAPYKEQMKGIELELEHIQHTIDALLHGTGARRIDLTVDEVSQRVEQLESAVQTHWEFMIQALHLTVDDVRAALRYSNTEAIVHYASEQFDMESGKGVPTINLIFPLILTDDANFSDLRILAKNPQARKLLQMTQLFSMLQRQWTAPTPQLQDAVRGRLEAQFSRAGVVPRGEGNTMIADDVLNYLFHSGLIDPSFQNDFYDVSSAVDSYFERLQTEARVQDAVSLDQVNEVKGQSLETIIQYAFGIAPDLSGAPPEHQRIVRWEAQRKLIEMMMLHEVMNTRRAILRNGSGPIDLIERKLEAPTSVAGQRVIILNGKEHVVVIERREKSPMSLLRKVMVRDQCIRQLVTHDSIAKDVFAESYVFTSREADVDWNRFSAPCAMTDKNNRPIEQFDAPTVVGELIQSLAQESEGGQVRVIEYKAPPRDGESFGSTGPGGGAPIRMAKFYIEHTDESGTVRYREVQVFLPRGKDDTWESGEDAYLRKKEDDQRYGVSRLFATAGLRSFMELNFPAEIYGDRIRQMYKGKV